MKTAAAFFSWFVLLLVGCIPTFSATPNRIVIENEKSGTREWLLTKVDTVIAEKNPLLMQIYADVTGCTMLVAGSSQACALGSAVSAAVLAGAHPDFPSAQAAMTSLKKVSYKPNPAAQATYHELYVLYRRVHDAFGNVNRSADLTGVMKELLNLKDTQTS